MNLFLLRVKFRVGQRDEEVLISLRSVDDIVNRYKLQAHR